jgi:hypothetical protein
VNRTISKPAGRWLWNSLVAGLCGSAAHTFLMYWKSRAGLLPAFQPYEALQLTLGRLTGVDVSRAVPWLLSWLNGSIIMGFAFGRSYRVIPGSNGAIKGLYFGLAGWMAMGLVFFPLIGLGPFGFQVGLGAAPALFSLAMLLTYSVVMGIAYAALNVLSESQGPP